MSVSAPPAERRTCTLTRSGGRLLIAWRVPHEQWHQVRRDFRATFPRHGQAIYRHATRCWSLPVRCRPELEEWIAAWGMEIVEEDNAHGRD